VAPELSTGVRSWANNGIIVYGPARDVKERSHETRIGTDAVIYLNLPYASVTTPRVVKKLMRLRVRSIQWFARFANSSYWIPGSSLVKFGVTGCFYRLPPGGTTDAASLGKTV
jgi:hypothetical protein